MGKTITGSPLLRVLYRSSTYKEWVGKEAPESDKIDGLYQELLKDIESVPEFPSTWEKFQKTFDEITETVRSWGNDKLPAKEDERDKRALKITELRKAAIGLKGDVEFRLKAIEKQREGIQKKVETLTADILKKRDLAFHNQSTFKDIRLFVDASGRMTDLDEAEKELDKVPEMITAACNAAEEFEGEYGDAKQQIDNYKLHPFADGEVVKSVELRYGKVPNVAKSDSIENARTKLTVEVLNIVAGAVKTADETEVAADQYPTLLEEVKNEAIAFPKISDTHRSYSLQTVNGLISNAGKSAELTQFTDALNLLEQARGLLFEYDSKAQSKNKNLNEQQAKALQLEKQQAAAKLQKAQQELAQRQREQVNNAGALLAIDKTSRFGEWLAKVKSLSEGGFCTIAGGAASGLNGEMDTVEVTCTVTGRYPSGTRTLNYRDNFKVHYHPKAGKADTNNPFASKMHLKPIRGNRTTPRTYIDNNHWVITNGYAPTLKGACG